MGAAENGRNRGAARWYNLRHIDLFEKYIYPQCVDIPSTIHPGYKGGLRGRQVGQLLATRGAAQASRSAQRNLHLILGHHRSNTRGYLRCAAKGGNRDSLSVRCGSIYTPSGTIMGLYSHRVSLRHQKDSGSHIVLKVVDHVWSRGDLVEGNLPLL